MRRTILLATPGPALGVASAAVRAARRRRRRSATGRRAGRDHAAVAARRSSPSLAAGAASRPGRACGTPARRRRTPSTASRQRRRSRRRSGVAFPASRRRWSKNGFAVVRSDLRPLPHGRVPGQRLRGLAGLRHHRRRLPRVAHRLRQGAAQTWRRRSCCRSSRSVVGGLVAGAHATGRVARGLGARRAAAGRVEQLYQLAAAELGLPSSRSGRSPRREKTLDRRAQRPERDLAGPRRSRPTTRSSPRAATTLSTPAAPAVLHGDVRSRPARRSACRARSTAAGSSRRGSGSSPPACSSLRPGARRALAVTSTSRPYSSSVAATTTRRSRSGTPCGGDRAGIADDTRRSPTRRCRTCVSALPAPRPVLISPDRAAIRIMGTRFVARLLRPRPAPLPLRRHSATIRARSRPRSTWRRRSARASPTACSDAAGRDWRTRTTTPSSTRVRQAVADRPPEGWGVDRLRRVALGARSRCSHHT